MGEIADNGLNRRIQDGEAVLKECDEVEAQIVELRVAYEQYFLGVERMPPNELHTQVKRRLSKLRNSFVRQTAMKFKVNNLQSKFSSYERLWLRTVKEIEDGTYKRDVYKAKLRTQKADPKKADKKANAEELPPEPVDDLLEPDEELPPLPAAPSVPAIPAVAPVSKTGIPAVAPLKQSSPGVPAVPPIAPPRVSSTGIPAVAPLKQSGGIPAVAPVSSPTVPAVPRVSSTGIPAVPRITAPHGIPAVAPVSSPGVPAVPPVRTNPGGNAAVPRTATGSGIPAVPAARAVSSPGVPRVSPPSGGGDGPVSEAKLKAVYDAYVTAKKRCQEDTSSISYESVAANLRKQVPELMKKHNAQGVEFKVVIKDGKAVLKAVPK